MALIEMSQEEHNAHLQRYIRDVKRLVDTDCPITRRSLRNMLSKTYSATLQFTKQEIDDDIMRFQVPPEIDFKESYTVDELFADTKEGSDFLISKLFTKVGLFMIASAPKTGKSCLSYSMVYSLVTGTPFLNRFPVHKSRVLYFQCEEPKGTITSRLDSLGFYEGSKAREEAKQEGSLRIYRTFDLTSELRKLGDLIDSFKPDVIIFDSLRAITSSSRYSETSPEFGKYVYALQRLMIQKKVCGIVLHHTLKSAEVRGINRVAGAGGVTGGTDGVILLDKVIENGRVCISVQTIPRRLPEMTFVYSEHRHPKTRRKSYEYLRRDRGKTVPESECEKLDNYEDRILEALAKLPDTWVTRDRLEALSGLGSEDVEVSWVLDELVDMMILGFRVNDELQEAEYFMASSSPYVKSYDIAKFVPPKPKPKPEIVPQAVAPVVEEAEEMYETEQPHDIVDEVYDLAIEAAQTRDIWKYFSLGTHALEVRQAVTERLRKQNPEALNVILQLQKQKKELIQRLNLQAEPTAEEILQKLKAQAESSEEAKAEYDRLLDAYVKEVTKEDVQQFKRYTPVLFEP